MLTPLSLLWEQMASAGRRQGRFGASRQGRSTDSSPAPTVAGERQDAKVAAPPAPATHGSSLGLPWCVGCQVLSRPPRGDLLPRDLLPRLLAATHAAGQRLSQLWPVSVLHARPSARGRRHWLTSPPPPGSMCACVRLPVCPRYLGVKLHQSARQDKQLATLMAKLLPHVFSESSDGPVLIGGVETTKDVRNKPGSTSHFVEVEHRGHAIPPC